MKRILALFLSLTLSILCGCGGAGETAPSPAAAATAAPAPSPEPAAVPEAPGSGYVSVHMKPVEGQVGEHAVSAMMPVVSITGREAAAQAIHEQLQSRQMPSDVPTAEPGEIRRTAAVSRSDSSVLSLCFTNRMQNNTFTDGVSFDTRTGEEITFSMLSEDEEALRAVCREICPDITPTDGQWYLNDSGLVLCGGEADAVVPYTEVFHLLKEAWMPPEREPVSGTLQVAYSTETDMDALDLLDEVSVSGGMESVILLAEGSVRDVHIAAVTFTEADGFQMENSLWNGSMLRNGQALRLNVTVPDGIPHVMIEWDTDDGGRTAYLARNGETGQVYLSNAAGGAMDADSPWAHITAESLQGHWYNDKSGAEGQAISFAGTDVCYLWHKGLGYEGDGFLWSLQRRDDQGLCPRILIATPKAQLVYEITALEGDTLETDAGSFFRAEAVG